LFPARTTEQKARERPVANLDDLEGAAYEDALAKLPEAERQKYLAAT